MPYTFNTIHRPLMEEQSSNMLEIEMMSRAKSYLDGIPVNIQTHEYANIIQLVNKYLHTHCKHSIVQDLIDIDPDHSKIIYYCEHCNITMDKAPAD